MSRLLPLVAVLGLLTVTAALADNTNPERSRGGKTTDADMKRLQGTWVVTGVEVNGQEAKESLPGIIGLKYTFGEGVWRSPPSQNAELAFSLDHDGRQSRIVLSTKIAEFPRMPLIYQLEGDTLRWSCCANHFGEPQIDPTDFTSQKDQDIWTLRRE